MAKRQEVIESAHPLVRRHPVSSAFPVQRVRTTILTIKVTGEPALFIGKYSVSHIEGLAEEESEMMMKFLYDMVASAHDLQARVKWQPGDVCVWDQVSLRFRRFL
jgi:sulfonate dioxygenase